MTVLRMMKKNRMNYNLFIIAVGVSICLLTGCGAEKEKAMTQEEIAGVFEHYNNILDWDGEADHPANDISGANSFDIREIAQQVDGFWEYYENYEKELKKLRIVIAEWEADFIPEGVFEVGVDLAPGYYVTCNPDLELAPGERVFYDPEGTGLESGMKRMPDAESDSPDSLLYSALSYYDAFFYITVLHEGEVVHVKGHPKFAPLEDFPALTAAEDGNYYGLESLYLYEIGKDIPAGEYFVLSMDKNRGELDYLGGGSAWAEHSIYTRSRFSYVDLQNGDIFSMDKCVLIPIEQKPAILPISHEDISYQNEEVTWMDFIELFFPKKKSGKPYEIPVYAEGEYIIGEDIPLGTYQIQNEITVSVHDVEETALHSDFEMDYDFSWTGLRLLDVWKAGEAGWSFIRIGYNGKYVQIGKTDGTSEYLQIDKGSLPEVTFDESDAGYVVRIVRCLLIPRE